MAETIKIGGRLHSTATGNIVTGANEVFDDSKNKKQSEINQELENKVNTKTTFHAGTFNAGNITEEGWYDEITSGRPSGSDDVGGTETYILYMSSSGSQICFSKKYSGKAYSRITKNDAWKRLDNSNVRDSGYGADNITEEGWYDNVNLTRPEGSESDEKYYLYHSANGGQICFSRRNSGKAYQRLGIGHPWVPLTHDDYSIENPLSALHKSCTLINTYGNSSISYHTSNGYGYDSLTDLTEYYAGDNNETTNFHISVGLNGLKPNDIVRVRCVYRRGFSAEGVNTYPYDSDAYMFVSKSIDSTNHSITNNESNWNKIKSMGGQNFPFTDGEKGWQDLAFMRDRFFDEDYEYSWHYIRVTAPQIGEDSGSTPGNYLHIYGDFTKPGSWFVFDKAEVYRASNNIYYSNIDLSQIPEGTLSGDVVTQLNKLRNDVLNANTKIVAFGFENADFESKSIYASISNNSNTFGVMISLGGAAMGLEYNYSSETWESTLVTFEQISNKVTSISSGSTDIQYPSAKAVYTNVSAKYTKPSTGIPKTDLASAIQTSLGKADTAVQPSDITSKENTSNKVTSISSGSTDTQYASAKAVYVAVNEEKVRATLAELNLNTDISKCFNSVSYSSTTETKEIIFKHDGTVVASLDATQFIKDGMVDNVEVVNGYLVITFNTDAGKEDIRISLSDIFDPNNYYDKTTTDDLLEDKEDKSNKVTSITSGSTDTQYASAKAVYREISKTYYVDFDFTQIQEGQITDEGIIAQLNKIRADALNENIQLILFHNSNTYSYKSMIASIENDDELFDIMISSGRAYLVFEYRYSNQEWSCVMREMEVTSNMVQTITSDSRQHEYPSARAVYTNVNAKYTKPSGGIPKSDLDSSVQESLDKANSAATQSYVDEIANSTELVLLDGEAFPIYVLESPTIYSWGLKNEDLYTYYNIESGGKLFGFLACSLNNTDYKIDIKAVNSSNQINLTYINLPDALSYYLSQPYISRPATTYGHGRINIPVDSIQSGDSLVFKGLYLYRVPQYVFEESKNKVTLIASDNTDEQYPSAKSVYTSVSVKYTKPYDGIPKTDLDSTVQSSLGNADTAVQPSELYTYVNNCEYDNVTHEIRLLNGSRTIATIDASEFIIDGMISNVTISGTNLVITFNTLSGSTQTISIPIADIFQPDNYYTKDEIDKIAYYSDISTEDITEGEITGTTKTKLQALRGNSGDAKFVVIGTSESAINRTGVVATIDSYGSVFQMWFVDKNRLCQITATPDDLTWSAHWETLATETYVNSTLPKEISTTSERVVMKPNNLYKLGVRGALEVVFRQGSPGYVNEYMFEFTSNTDSFSLTVPSGVKWLYEPEITSGNTYQVSILNNLAVIAEWVNE